MPAEAFINREYISNAGDKIEIYRRLAVVRDEVEIKYLREEITDRFGKITEPVENLLQIGLIRLAAKNLGITSVKEKDLRVEIVFSDVKKLSAQGIIELNREYRRDFKFVEDTRRIFITFRTKKEILIRILTALRKLGG